MEEIILGSNSKKEQVTRTEMFMVAAVSAGGSYKYAVDKGVGL